MDRQKLNLQHLTSTRERELLDLVRDTEFDRILRGEVDLGNAPSGQKFIGDRTPIAQDAFSAILLRQGRVHQPIILHASRSQHDSERIGNEESQ